MPQHISIRVPWHDNGWDGTVCKDPRNNISCLRLSGISDNRDEDFEQSVCARCMNGLEEKLPCISEGVSFMSDKTLTKTQIHPYKEIRPNLYSHFLETTVEYPPYSLSARPYSWLLLKNITELNKYYGIKYEPSKEPGSFKTNWVQHGDNHKAVFDYFYRDIVPDESLVVIYAKQVPFCETPGRVIIGMGTVTDVVPAVEHNHTDEGTMTSYTWESHICHSIRKDNKNGFLIPYEKMLQYSLDNPDFDLNTIIVKSPDYALSEYSYATEHLSYDALIDTIESCIDSFRIINDCLDEDYTNVIEWLKEKRTAVWKQRGLFPGFGPMLCAMGVEWGMSISSEFKNKLDSEKNFWTDVDDMFENPERYLSKDSSDKINEIVKDNWRNMSQERKQLFRLLSRYTLSIHQANVFFNPDIREKHKIRFADEELIENPYILYERTRLKAKDIDDSLFIDIKNVDKAIFPVDYIYNENPLPDPSGLSTNIDKRRIRALAISVLEKAADNGHTIYPEFMLINSLRELLDDQKELLSYDVIQSMNTYFDSEMYIKKMEDGKRYYKLIRIEEFDQTIERRVKKRIKSEQKLIVKVSWRDVLDKEFGEIKDRDEETARKEKAAVLKVLAESRLSVLIGGAGTGKTKTLSILCHQKEISKGGVLLLAPTGKATVRLSESLMDENKTFRTMNIAQLLFKCDRYDKDDRRYILEGKSLEGIEETVIIDEASMLTTEMMGALLNTIRSAKRIIFVGDPHQLPPIGSGRPFVDLVNILKQNCKQSFPKVGNCYGELTVNRRQKETGKDRLDTKLSLLFSGKEDILDEDVLSEIGSNNDENIKIYKWESKDDLQQKLLEISGSMLGMKDSDDKIGFNKALGANVVNDFCYFNLGCASTVDEWQILSPVHNQVYGVTNINHLFHKKYREDFLNLLKGRRIPKPFGPEGIIYGDKVINTTNKWKKSIPENKESANYVANGEMGIVCECFSSTTEKPLSVEFSSQKGKLYTYKESDVQAENNTADLDLAYALTVHKAQGSQFRRVILVLSEPCGLLSRELLYTALTRQVDEIVILYNGEPYQLLQYTSEDYSEISRRFTDLFSTLEGFDYKPRIVEINNKFYDDKLIHRTEDNKLVRSKSEVIICNILHNMDIDYEYEQELYFEDENKSVHPDFTIYDEDEGKTWYWEHCGMLEDEKYNEYWSWKKKIYERHGIFEGKNLIVTRDVNGAIDSYEIKKMVGDLFG